MAAFHQLEREKTSERAVTRGKERKRLGMRYLRDAPYGKRFEGETVDAKGKRSGGTEVDDEKEQAVIMKMKKWRSQGWTLRRIANELNKTGVPTRRGKPWSKSSVHDILDTIDERLGKKKREDGKGNTGPDLKPFVEGDFKEPEE
jgi:transposase